MTELEKILKKWNVPTMAVTSLLFTLLPMAMRLSSGKLPLVQPESYGNLWLMKNEAVGGSFIMILDFLAPVFKNDQQMMAISIVLTVCASLFFYASLRGLGLDRTRSFFSFLILLMSPMYAYLNNTLTEYPFILFLLALSFYLVIKTQNLWLSLFISLPVAALNIAVFLAYVLMIFALVKRTRNDNFVLLAYSLAGAALWMAFPNRTNLFQEAGLNSILVNFGSTIGYSLFALLLAIAGISIAWSRKNKNIHHAVFMLLMLLSLAMPSLRILMIFPVSVYAAMTLSFLLKRKWHVDFLKEATLLIIFSSLLFSSISYMDRIDESEPTEEFINIMELIAAEDRPGKVLGSLEIGPLISYFSGKEAYVPSGSEKDETYRTIFAISSPSETKRILDREGITYIYISREDMEPFTERGMMRVLENSDNFIRLGAFDESEVWLYIRI